MGIRRRRSKLDGLLVLKNSFFHVSLPRQRVSQSDPDLGFIGSYLHGLLVVVDRCREIALASTHSSHVILSFGVPRVDLQGFG